MKHDARLGLGFIAAGLAVSAFHLNLLLVNRDKTPKLAYGVGVLGGVVMLNVGSNRIASSLHQ